MSIKRFAEKSYRRRRLGRRRLGRRGLPLALILACLLSILFLSPVSSERPAAVELIYFRGEGEDGAVHLEWATATELDTVGFEIERSTQSSGPYQKLSDIGFVSSLATDAFSGANYEVRDRSGIVNGQTYYYILVEIEFDGSENRTPPEAVTAGVSQSPPTATQPAAQSNPTSQPTSASGGNTPQSPTSTPRATATSQGASSSPNQTPSGTIPSATSTSRAVAQSNSPSSLDSTNSSTGVSNSNDVPVSNLAQVEPTDEAYPAPFVTPILNDDGGTGNAEVPYPGLAPDTIEQPLVEPGGYPALEADNQPPTIAPSLGSAPAIGSDSNQNTADSAADDSQQTSIANPVLSTVLLWVGFLVAFLIFVLGVVGSIYWYSRRHSS